MAKYIEECQKHTLLPEVYFGQRTVCLLYNHEPHLGKMLLRCVMEYDAVLVCNWLVLSWIWRQEAPKWL